MQKKNTVGECRGNLWNELWYVDLKQLSNWSPMSPRNFLKESASEKPHGERYLEKLQRWRQRQIAKGSDPEDVRSNRSFDMAILPVRHMLSGYKLQGISRNIKGLKLLDFVRVVDVVASKDGFVQKIGPPKIQ